ncbi:MAG: hypothetical protein Q8R30_03015 [bacterium]|nr:hypothetical protein [bacterium]
MDSKRRPAMMLEITFNIDKDLWDKLKKLSGDLEDAAFLIFLFQVGEYILEAIKRKSVIFEINGKTKEHEAIDFADLLDQYGLEELEDFIKKAKPEDFS